MVLREPWRLNTFYAPMKETKTKLPRATNVWSIASFRKFALRICFGSRSTAQIKINHTVWNTVDTISKMIKTHRLKMYLETLSRSSYFTMKKRLESMNTLFSPFIVSNWVFAVNVAKATPTPRCRQASLGKYCSIVCFRRWQQRRIPLKGYSLHRLQFFIVRR